MESQKIESEQCGDVSLYLQRATTEDGLSLAVWRCGMAPNEKSTQPPVVLIPGNYTNRRFWISPSGKGFAAYLYKAGYDVWIGETRGHGHSDGGPLHPHPDYRRWQIEDVVRYDLAAIATAVSTGNSGQQHWFGHSFGGVYTVAALSLGHLNPESIASLIIAGTQVNEGQPWLTNSALNLTVRGATRLLRRFPAKALKLGSEDEPPGISNETLHWKRHRRWKSTRGTDYSQGLEHLQMPLLVLAGRGDTMDPISGCEEFVAPIGSSRKTFLKLGKDEGYERDYGHVDMLVSPAAQREIWPKVEEWLRLRVQEVRLPASGKTTASREGAPVSSS